MRISTLAIGVVAVAAPLTWAQATQQQPAYQQQQGMPCPCPHCPGAAAATGTMSTAAQKRQASRLAAQMIQETDMARKALRRNDRAQANSHINEAINLAQRLQNMQPGRNIIPVYAELESTTLLQPIIEARGSQAGVTVTGPRTDEFQQQPYSQPYSQPDQTRQQSQMQQQNQMQQQQPGVVVESTRGQFTFIGVNTSNSLAHLQASRTALNNNNPVAADDALRAVQSDVVAARVTADMPLLTARQNLALASNYAKQGRYQEASVALDSASNALSEYAQRGGAHSAEAQSLQQQIRSYQQTIQQQQPQQASAQIDSWWDQTANWFRQG